MPQIDFEDFHWFMGVKFAAAVLMFRTLSLPMAFLLMLAANFAYRLVLAKLLGLKVMDVGDFNTFVTNQ